MKRTMILTVGVLGLMAGSAHAAGCAYSNQQAKMAAAETPAEPVMSGVQQQESDLLALLKKREDEMVEPMPVVHN